MSENSIKLNIDAKARRQLKCVIIPGCAIWIIVLVMFISTANYSPTMSEKTFTYAKSQTDTIRLTATEGQKIKVCVDGSAYLDIFVLTQANYEKLITTGTMLYEEHIWADKGCLQTEEIASGNYVIYILNNRNTANSGKLSYAVYTDLSEQSTLWGVATFSAPILLASIILCLGVLSNFRVKKGTP